MTLTAPALTARLTQLRSQIAAAATAAGRASDDITVVLASKTQPIEAAVCAFEISQELGIRVVLGENRVQELTAKAALRPDLPWHFIGHLQRNKINQVLPAITCLQTIDTAELATAVAKRHHQNCPLDVFLQVNVSGEASKSGCHPSAVPALAAAVAVWPQLRLRGLMTIGLPSPNPSAVMASYQVLAQCRSSLVSTGLPGLSQARELSMGMSGDFALAIAAGATMIRLGSAVFGARP